MISHTLAAEGNQQEYIRGLNVCRNLSISAVKSRVEFHGCSVHACALWDLDEQKISATEMG